MATLSHKYTLFETTSPRTPSLMIPDIRLLTEHFSGRKWDRETQESFTEMLYAQDEAKGRGLKSGYKDMVARDRINRSPKKFGFVRLSPFVSLTPAGQRYLDSPRNGEVLLRQLLKYQFWVKPYLELFRLIRHFGSVSFDEMMLFGLQLTDYRIFDTIITKIDAFRKEKLSHKGKYKQFLALTAERVVSELFADFRHLRDTGMVNLSQSGHAVSIVPDKLQEVDFFLESIDRSPWRGLKRIIIKLYYI